MSGSYHKVKEFPLLACMQWMIEGSLLILGFLGLSSDYLSKDVEVSLYDLRNLR